MGVSKFIRGLPGDMEIKSPPKLKDYLKEKRL